MNLQTSLTDDPLSYIDSFAFIFNMVLRGQKRKIHFLKFFVVYFVVVASEIFIALSFSRFLFEQMLNKIKKAPTSDRSVLKVE